MRDNFLNSLGESYLKKRERERKEDIRNEFFRDQTAIIHSMGFRRLKNKTQVFFSPENDHVCTRIEHVLHVSTISTVICKNLGLNFELAQAIALGHDLGHAPFGHAGEEIITQMLNKNNHNKEFYFFHEIHSLRVVDKLENNGEGLNLTWAVRDGILSHNGEKFEQFIVPEDKKKELEEIKMRNTLPATWEGCVVRMADKISYLGRDMEDAIKAYIISEDDIPKKIRKKLGKKNGEIIDTLVKDLINWSKKNNKIGFSEEIFTLIKEIKNFNYERIYHSEIILDYAKKAKKVIEIIYNHLIELYDTNGWHFEKYSGKLVPLNGRFGNYLKKMRKLYEKEGSSGKQIVIDYIAGMTDSYALKCANEIIFPKPISFDINN